MPIKIQAFYNDAVEIKLGKGNPAPNPIKAFAMYLEALFILHRVSQQHYPGQMDFKQNDFPA